MRGHRLGSGNLEAARPAGRGRGGRRLAQLLPHPAALRRPGEGPRARSGSATTSISWRITAPLRRINRVRRRALPGRDSGTSSPGASSVIAFGVSATEGEAYRRYTEPGIELAKEPDSQVYVFAAVGQVARTYNLLLEAARAHDDLEALVLVHPHTKITDPELCAKVRQALSDPEVAVVGAVGATGVRTIAWWEGEISSGAVTPALPGVRRRGAAGVFLETSRARAAGGGRRGRAADGAVALGRAQSPVRRGARAGPRLRRGLLLPGPTGGTQGRHRRHLASSTTSRSSWCRTTALGGGPHPRGREVAGPDPGRRVRRRRANRGGLEAQGAAGGGPARGGPLDRLRQRPEPRRPRARPANASCAGPRDPVLAHHRAAAPPQPLAPQPERRRAPRNPGPGGSPPWRPPPVPCPHRHAHAHETGVPRPRKRSTRAACGAPLPGEPDASCAFHS